MMCSRMNNSECIHSSTNIHPKSESALLATHRRLPAIPCNSIPRRLVRIPQQTASNAIQSTLETICTLSSSISSRESPFTEPCSLQFGAVTKFLHFGAHLEYFPKLSRARREIPQPGYVV